MTRGLHWFRRDLRRRDNKALAALCDRADEFLPVFVLDSRLLEGDHASGPRTRFLLDCLKRLADDFAERDVPLLVRAGKPEDVLPKLLDETGAELLSFNADVSPFARERDAAVKKAAEKAGAKVITRRDDVVFTSSQIQTKSGGPYAVYTPYRNAWWKRWDEDPQEPTRASRLPNPIPGFTRDEVPSAADLGLDEDDAVELPTGGEDAAMRRLAGFLDDAVARYAADRDKPYLDGTSRMSPYLRFGAISIRDCFARGKQAARDAKRRKGVSKWLDELVWREFYAGILEENPRVLRESYRREYDSLQWNDDDEGFEAWCEGRTGYPIVDAGMRQLRRTGWVHNRVRMIVASFLTKDLLIDWRRGERFFFQRLVDGDPASNNGGWQWAASTGTDAQPYFRIFNPSSQGERWDPEGEYVREWVPELANFPKAKLHSPWEADSPPDDYPGPIVDHGERRKEALERYKKARATGSRL